MLHTIATTLPPSIVGNTIARHESDINNKIELTYHTIHFPNHMMHLPQHMPSDITSTNSAKINIISSTQLAINMNVQHYTKTSSKRRTKYRPVQRIDGVVTEYPRYQVKGAPVQEAFKFEKHIFTLDGIRGPSTIGVGSPESAEREKDLRGVGAFAEAYGRDGYNRIVEYGRGGYNAPTPMHAKRNGYADFPDQRPIDSCAGLAPMQRFLEETGSWSEVSLQLG